MLKMKENTDKKKKCAIKKHEKIKPVESSRTLFGVFRKNYKNENFLIKK